MNKLDLDPNVNVSACAKNNDRKVLIIETDDYKDYNFISLHNYYRVFAIIGLITLLLLIPMVGVIGKIANQGARIGIGLFLLVLIVFGYMGFVGLMIACSKFYNITEQIYIYDNPKLGNKTCNITYGFSGDSDIYTTQITKTSVGFLQFTVFFLLVGLTLLTGLLLMNAFAKRGNSD
jgi:hypothetical protein